jgi:hypothetical protein
MLFNVMRGGRTLNEARMWAVLDFIRTNPRAWNQRHWVRHFHLPRPWRARTTRCLAGWTYALGTGDHTAPDRVRPILNALGLPDLQGWRIQLAAEHLLGLDVCQAMRLFHFMSVPCRRRFLAWTWETERHPTFGELVAQVHKVTGFRYDPDRPPASGAATQVVLQDLADARLVSVPLVRSGHQSQSVGG